MKTEKQKMQDGSLYNADDEELIQERLKTKEVLYKYNQTPPSDRKESYPACWADMGTT